MVVRIMKILVCAIILSMLGATFLIPESLSFNDRLTYLNEEMAALSPLFSASGFEPDHPSVGAVLERADDVRVASYKRNFNLVALITAPTVAFMAFFFLRPLYTEVAFLVSSVIIFFFFHGATPMLGALFFVAFLWGVKIVGASVRGFDEDTK